MNTVMSTTMIPDIYRHTARKSTVSRNVKSQTKNVSSSTPPFPSPYLCKEEPSIFETIQCDIKVEQDIPLVEQSLVLMPDNEMEHVMVEQTSEETIREIIEQIQTRIQEDAIDQIDGFERTTMNIASEIHEAIDSLMSHFDEDHNEQSVNTTNTESEATANEDASMASERQSSMLSRSKLDDDDIVEIEVSRSDPHPSLCTCQCHQTTTNATADYLLFEQALRHTRQEQQQERCLDNNRLIQTLKRQHQELMTFYQRQLYINKIDREQQTVQISKHDTHIQTDISAIQAPIAKPTMPQTNGKHSTPIARNPVAVSVRPFASFLTPIRTKGPSLQQLIPCLTTTTIATFPSKASGAKKSATVTPTNTNSSAVPPVSQDVVDLTEEDDDDGVKSRVPTPSRPQQSPATTVTSTAGPTQTQPATRSNPVTPVGQTFPLRPLPETTPPDPSIARPQLSITQDNAVVRLTWNLPSTPMESIQNYEIYAYKQNAVATTSDWKKIGTVKSMRLPMAVTLKEFQSNSHYAFAVRGVSINNQFGPFCEPKTIFTGTTPVSSLNPSQTLNGST